MCNNGTHSMNFFHKNCKTVKSCSSSEIQIWFHSKLLKIYLSTELGSKFEVVQQQWHCWREVWSIAKWLCSWPSSGHSSHCGQAKTYLFAFPAFYDFAKLLPLFSFKSSIGWFSMESVEMWRSTKKVTTISDLSLLYYRLILILLISYWL